MLRQSIIKTILNFIKTTMPQIVIFTDIDNTLIQSHVIQNNKIIHKKNYGNIKSIINKLNEKKIPLILCSSKTMAEQIKLEKNVQYPIHS